MVPLRLPLRPLRLPWLLLLLLLRLWLLRLRQSAPQHRWQLPLPSLLLSLLL